MRGLDPGCRLHRRGPGRGRPPGRRAAAAVGTGRGLAAAIPWPDAAIPDRGPIVARVDESFRARWAEQELAPAAPAPELAVMRRLSLSLCGTIPSLEEIRRFESRPAGRRIDAWLDDLLRDRRCADYLAERFARAFVGTEDGPFLLFRRRRFVAWLSDAILENRPYDAIVRDLIADDGLWTDHPATNFLTVTIDEKTERPTPDRLAARVSRAFLGVRLDCAQCHDHPFQPWKQADFRGLAAFFGAVPLRPPRHPRHRERLPAARPQGQGVRSVEPRVPFLPELLPAPRPAARATGSPRWVTDPRNPNLARATVNRVWALLFGRPLAEPVDDLPAAGELHPALLAPGRRLRRARLRPAPADPGHRRHRGRSASTARPTDAERGARGGLGRLPHDPPAARAGRRRPVPGRPRSRPSARSRTGSRGWSPTPAATISSAATATPARTSSTPAAARSPSASC